MTETTYVDLDDLSADAIDSTPIHFDWFEDYPRDNEAWESYEAVECDDCGLAIIYDDDHAESGAEECAREGWTHCTECGRPIYDDANGDWLHSDTDGARCEGGASTANPRPECDNVGLDARELGAEGPMMNYYYPLPHSSTAYDDMARLLADTCLCVVSFSDGRRDGLALTGGGMDLTWEVCEAFVRLGYLPPVHFAANLPKMAGGRMDFAELSDRDRHTADAARLALTRAAQRATRDVARFDSEWHR